MLSRCIAAKGVARYAPTTLIAALGVSLSFFSAWKWVCLGGGVAGAEFLAVCCKLHPHSESGRLETEHAANDGPEPSAVGEDATVTTALARLAQTPASSQRWIEAGRIFYSENRLEPARHCFQRAVELAPHSPPTLLETASFFHASGDVDRGLDLMSRVLAATRAYDGVVFAFYTRLGDVPTVLRHGLPLDPGAARAYFGVQLESDAPNTVHRTWDWLCRHQFADGRTMRRYLSYLLEHQNYDQAVAVLKNFLPPRERPKNSERVVHGGFEFESIGAPLDWTVTAIPHAQVRRDNSSAWEGAWSLRFEFDGKANLEYRHVSQHAVVSPGRWRLAARIRTRNISGDQGVGLRIFDARSASNWQVWTEAFRGNSDWRLLETTVTIPESTRLVRIEIVRRPSRKLDNKLGGIAWVDAVSLTPW